MSKFSKWIEMLVFSIVFLSFSISTTDKLFVMKWLVTTFGILLGPGWEIGSTLHLSLGLFPLGDVLSCPCDASVLLMKHMWSWIPEFASYRSKKDRVLQRGHCNTLMEVFCNASYRHSLCWQWTSCMLGKAGILVRQCENTFVFFWTKRVYAYDQPNKGEIMRA